MIKDVFRVSTAFALILSSSAQGGGVAEETTEQVYPIGANPTLTVRNLDGRVFVYGSEDHQISVKAYKRAFTKERLSQIEVKTSRVEDAISVETVLPPPAKGLLADRSGTVEYTVLVPQHTAVNVELSQGEIQFEGLRGPSVNCRLTNGRISVRNCFGPAQITIGSGGIDVDYTWWEARTFAMSFDAGKGDVALLLPPAGALRLDAATRGGHIRNLLVEGSEDVQQLNTAIRGGSEVEMKIRTGDGNIKIGKAY